MIDTQTNTKRSSLFRFFTQRSGLQKIIANTGWLFADHLAATLAGFIVGAWVARYLGPSQYGTYNYALAVVALFTPLVALGLKDIVVRDIVRTPDEKNEILGTTLGLQFIGALLSLALAVGIAFMGHLENRLTSWLIVISSGQFIFQVVSVTLGYWFNSQVQAKYIVWANNIALFFYSIARIILVLAKAPLITFAWVALGQAFIYAVATAVFYRFSGQTFVTWRANFARAKQLLENSWPLLISSLAIMVYLKIGQVMLGNMVDEKALGIYSAAIRLSELWYFIPMAIAASVFPAIVRSHEQDGEDVHRQRMQIFYDIMSGIAFVIVIPLVVFAPFLVRIVFGSSYEASASILRIHAWALLFVFLGVARSRWLIAEDMVRFNMFVTLLGAGTNIVANFLLIPKLGGEGAAWSVVITQAVSAYLSSMLSKKAWPVFRQQSLSLLVPFRIFSLKKALAEMLRQNLSI